MIGHATFIVLVLAGFQASVAPTRPVWHGQEPGSPKIADGTFALDIAVRPVRGSGGASTVAVFAAANLPGSYEQIYGGRIDGAINVIALDDGERVYHAAAEPAGTVPLAAAMNPAVRPPPPGVAPSGNLRTWVNVDLRGHLRAPREPATYRIFAWIDEFVSPVRVARLEGARGTPTLPVEPVESISIRAAGPARISGTLTRSTSAPAAVTVFTLGFSSRNLVSRRLTVPAGSSTFVFDLSPARERTYVVAVAGKSITSALALEAR